MESLEGKALTVKNQVRGSLKSPLDLGGPW